MLPRMQSPFSSGHGPQSHMTPPPSASRFPSQMTRHMFPHAANLTPQQRSRQPPVSNQDNSGFEQVKNFEKHFEVTSTVQIDLNLTFH